MTDNSPLKRAAKMMQYAEEVHSRGETLEKRRIQIDNSGNYRIVTYAGAREVSGLWDCLRETESNFIAASSVAEIERSVIADAHKSEADWETEVETTPQILSIIDSTTTLVTDESQETVARCQSPPDDFDSQATVARLQSPHLDDSRVAMTWIQSPLIEDSDATVARCCSPSHVDSQATVGNIMSPVDCAESQATVSGETDAITQLNKINEPEKRGFMSPYSDDSQVTLAGFDSPTNVDSCRMTISGFQSPTDDPRISAVNLASQPYTIVRGDRSGDTSGRSQTRMGSLASPVHETGSALLSLMNEAEETYPQGDAKEEEESGVEVIPAPEPAAPLPSPATVHVAEIASHVVEGVALENQMRVGSVGITPASVKPSAPPVSSRIPQKYLDSAVVDLASSKLLPSSWPADARSRSLIYKLPAVLSAYYSSYKSGSSSARKASPGGIGSAGGGSGVSAPHSASSKGSAKSGNHMVPARMCRVVYVPLTCLRVDGNVSLAMAAWFANTLSTPLEIVVSSQ
jgi:hypothetical protein